MPRFHELSYWNERYIREPGLYDWYQTYHRLAPLFAKYLQPKHKILQIGTGMSPLGQELVQVGGFTSVTCMDWSEVVVKGMKALHSGVDGLEYMQADARSMPEVPVASFDAVIDKGTLDANMCGEAHEGITASQSIMLECYRVLKPGGRFIEITYGAPVDRLPVLGDRWRELEVFVLPKALPQGHAATAVDTRDCAAAIRGPFAAKDEDMMASLSGLEGVHFAFVAKK